MSLQLDSARILITSDSSFSAVSAGSDIQVEMKIPLYGYIWKFSAMLSTIMVLVRSRPSLDKSLT
jgi:hypothetical protein